jgi:predicted aspartyl protease
VKRLVPAAVALTALATLVASPAAAEMVRYTDANGNAHYVDGFDNVPPQYRASAVPLGLHNAPRGATTEATTASRPAAATGQSAPKGGAAIKYTPGQQIMVDAKINGTTNVRLLLDTGADGTMINPRALVAAGASISRPVATSRVTGVAGSDTVHYVVIESLEIGEARVGRMRVASYEVAGAGDGLLGRDFLDRFSVNIDSTNGIVTLSPK